MIIHLVRHAHAGNRSTWSGDDSQRPLTDTGRAQATAIADALDTEITAATSSAGDSGDGPPVRILSSPYVRCLQTLEPLADHLGCAVVPVDLLAEGVSGRAALDLLIDALDGDTVVVACSHGDVIPAVIATALGQGATLDGDPAPRKAARYRMQVANGQVTHITHVPRPEI